MKDIDIKLYLMWSDYRCSLNNVGAMAQLWWWVVRGKPYLETLKESVDFFWENLSYNSQF